MDLKEAIERIKRKITIGECEKNIGIPVYISDLKVVLSELEKKDKIIDEMAEYMNLLSNELIAETGINDLKFCELEACTNNPEIECKQCIKDYFTKKVEGK